jgi:uncharacterized protein
MKADILNKLQEIEKENDIGILYACESGSRGWGFASPDSDYDVRFIYARSQSSYLSIVPKADQLSFPINNDLDIYGWDLQKALRLILNSNTTPFEWLQSPIVYLEKGIFKQTLFELCAQYFNQRKNVHHYLGIARGALDSITSDAEIKIKKLFYILRPLLAANWCLERKCIAPMEMFPLMDLLPKDICKLVSNLIEIKAKANEGQLVKINGKLLNYIFLELDYCMNASAQLPKEYFDPKPLNDFFTETITENDYQRFKNQRSDTVGVCKW